MTTNEKLTNDCVSPFNEAQRARLQYLSKVCEDGGYSALPNIPLETYIEELKDLYPNMFHTKESLKTRVFFDEPVFNIPHASFVRAKEQSPHRSHA
jgi:hypothetical protein